MATAWPVPVRQSWFAHRSIGMSNVGDSTEFRFVAIALFKTPFLSPAARQFNYRLNKVPVPLLHVVELTPFIVYWHCIQQFSIKFKQFPSAIPIFVTHRKQFKTGVRLFHDQTEWTRSRTRHRASLLRKEKEDRDFMRALLEQGSVEPRSYTYQDLVETDKPKRTRMQNAKGTAGMFIKPWRTSDKSQQLPTRKGQKSNRSGKF